MTMKGLLIMKLTRIIIPWLMFWQVDGQHYEDTHGILKTLLNSNDYSPEVVPLSNQSQSIKVRIAFHLISIVAVDDTSESFSCNGFINFRWVDEKLQWNATNYGNRTMIHPLPRQIWRPKVILLNTMNDRDLFGDDLSPITVYSSGDVVWAPGSLFHSSCTLNLQKYPYDEQMCSIIMYPMALSMTELEFEAGDSFTDFYQVNGEWALLDCRIVVSPSGAEGFLMSRFEIQVHIKRRSIFYVLTIILPFVFLSFLNLWVFAIPQESGEKIGYGITVLLALSVFFSIVGGMLPRSSNVVPYVIIYLFILYLISALTVIASIFIVYIYHLEERVEHQKKLKARLKRIVSKWQKPKRHNIIDIQARPDHTDTDTKLKTDPNLSDALDHSHSSKPGHEKEEDGRKKPNNGKEDRCNNKLFAATVDFCTGYFFLAIWLIVTTWFFVAVLA